MKHFVAVLLSFLVLTTYCQTSISMKQKKAVLVIHGGAGTILRKNMTTDKELAYKSVLEQALMAGKTVLDDSGTSTEAVIAAIEILENSPLFNAGKGAVFTHNETNELDASIMEGSGKNAGAISGVTIVKNPIKLAASVLHNSEHVMLSGKGAESFAIDQQIDTVPPSYFYSKTRFMQLQKIKDQDTTNLDHDGDQGSVIDSSEIEFDLNLLPEDKKFGTVGAAALDKFGNISAGTSTGGMTNKRYGRVGDSPIIGAGTYADNATCAVSCTGHGEYFIRFGVAYDLHARMLYQNISLDSAAHNLIHEDLLKSGGNGGLIALDKAGNYVMTFNTSGMYRGVLFEDGTFEVALYGSEE